ncbi:myosin-7B-like isoform X2 [Clupea harengus]|uniref:Myosin-7B-like isoform X2 n=1 Tax=Clupea harengus TaxID=7950 RepID=A0A8M1KK65_CLUHA|nr:myosin-7B-like isoform X2 [Clupea harengus]
MDTGDFTAPRAETPFKVEGAYENHGSDRCTPESESVSDSSETVSETYSVLMAELHKEINECDISHKEELHAFLSSKLKPLLDKFVCGMSKVHHLSEQLQLALEFTGSLSPDDKDPLDKQTQLCVPLLKDMLSKIGFEKNMDDLQNYLISSDRACLLSDLEALRMELRDLQQRHQVTTQGLQESLHATEEHYKALIARLQQGLQSSETQVQYLQQLFRTSEENVETLRSSLHTSKEEKQSLQQDQCVSEDCLRVLNQELSGYEGRLQTIQQQLQVSEESVQLLQKNLRVSEDLCQSLQQRLLLSEEKAQTLQEAAELWEGQAKSTDSQKQLREKELEAVHEQKVKKLMRAFRTSKENLESQQQEALRCLKEAAERERALREAVATEQTQHQREIEKLQEDADRAKEDKVKVEHTLRGQIIGLKNQLVEELCRANKKLEGSAKYEKELQDTVKDLRKALRQQKEGCDLALDCLRKRHHDVTTVQRLLEANIQYCSLASVRPETQTLHNAPLRAQSSPLQPQELRQDLQEVKTQLDSATKKEEHVHHEDRQGRGKWEEVLKGAEDWQREAEGLVNSLEYVKMDLALKGAQRDANDGPCALSSPPSTAPSSRPHSAGMDLQRPAAVEDCCPAGTNNESLAAVQRRLRNLQTVHFQKNLKEFLRLP